MEYRTEKVEQRERVREGDRTGDLGRHSRRAWRGCNEATAELTVGSCRVLGDFFYDLGEAFARTRPAERGGRRRPFVSDAADSVCDSVTRGVSSSARTIQRSLERFSDNLDQPVETTEREEVIETETVVTARKTSTPTE